MLRLGNYIHYTTVYSKTMGNKTVTNHDMQILISWSCSLKTFLIVSRALVLDLGSCHIEDSRVIDSPVAIDDIMVISISQGCKKNKKILKLCKMRAPIKR